MNLAQLLGPLIGGALCQAGGFYLPFVSMGGLQGAMGLMSLLLLPELSSVKNDNQDGAKRKELFALFLHFQ